MAQPRRRRKIKRTAETRKGMKKYLVTILPTFGPMEIVAENSQEAEELAANYWDEGWDGEFTTEIEEKEGLRLVSLGCCG